MSLETFDLRLPRNAFNTRESARAGDVWRLLQDAAILGSTRRGWPPSRYNEENCAFIMRRMTAVHHQSAVHGACLPTRTWVATFRRGMFSNREIRVEQSGEPLVSATQEWVHVRQPDLALVRANDALQTSFAVCDLDPPVTLPSFTPHPAGTPFSFSFDCWHMWMDPLAHANHPLYVDWCDESLNRRLAAAGLHPDQLTHLAEQVTWKSGVVAPERVSITSEVTGITDDGVVLTHTIAGEDQRTCATAITVRGLTDGGQSALLHALS